MALEGEVVGKACGRYNDMKMRSILCLLDGVLLVLGSIAHGGDSSPDILPRVSLRQNPTDLLGGVTRAICYSGLHTTAAVRWVISLNHEPFWLGLMSVVDEDENYLGAYQRFQFAGLSNMGCCLKPAC